MMFGKMHLSIVAFFIGSFFAFQGRSLMIQNGRNNAGNADSFSRLQITLRKIYPLEYPVVATNSDSNESVRICWKFFRPDPLMINKLGEAAASYQGDLSWTLTGGEKGQTCFAIRHRKGSDREGPHANLDAQLFSSDKFSEVSEFCQHIESVFDLTNALPKLFNYDYREPPFTELTDFWDPGTHSIWVVPRPSEFARAYQSESDQAKRLHFGLGMGEWIALYSDVFGWSPTQIGGQPDFERTRLYPTLRKLSMTESETFDHDEIRNLREECIRAYEHGHDARTFQALNKLVLASNWALELNRGLYFRGP
jgi:hypothetical protein